MRSGFADWSHHEELLSPGVHFHLGRIFRMWPARKRARHAAARARQFQDKSAGPRQIGGYRRQTKHGTGRLGADKKIRSAIISDKSLSIYAHNVKIIAQNGKVTLKGPVRSAEEKAAVFSKATEVAGEGNVTDQMDVAPPKS